MAATIVSSKKGGSGSKALFLTQITITGDDSYPDGGYPFDLSDYIGEATLICDPIVQYTPAQIEAGAMYVAYDATAETLVFYDTNATELADETDAESYSFKLLLIAE